MRRDRWLLAPAAALWLIGVAGPLLLVLRLSLTSRGARSGAAQFDVLFYEPGTWTLENFVRILTDGHYLGLVGFTAGLAFTVTGITVALGYVLAWAIHTSPPRLKVLLIGLTALPKFANVLVFLFSVKFLFPDNGLIPVVVAEVLLLLPYAALTLAAAMEAVPLGIVDAARGLGASPWRAFRFVTLPLSTPGLLAAGTLTLLWSLGAFLGPYLLGEPRQYTLAVEVDRQTNFDLNWSLAAALNVLLLGIVTGAGYALTRLQRRFS